MSESDSFTFSSNDRVVEVHSDLINACEGNYCAACILWALSQRQSDQPIRAPLPDIQTWVNGIFRRVAIFEAIRYLMSRGFVRNTTDTCRSDPKDRANFYELDNDKINTAILFDQPAVRQATTASIKPKSKVRFKVLCRDKFTCQYCGRKAPEVTLEVDHKFPAAFGGPSVIDNYITACHDCNSGKGAMVVDDVVLL